MPYQLKELCNYLIPYFWGFGFALIIGTCLLSKISDILWEEITDDKNKRMDLHLWYSTAVGVLERFLYIIALLNQFGEFLGLWIAFKVVGRWERSKLEFEKLMKGDKNQIGKLKAQAIYNIFTIGNALSIIYAVVGWKIISWMNKGQGYKSIFVGLCAILFSFIFINCCRKHSQSLKQFKKDNGAEGKSELSGQ